MVCSKGVLRRALRSSASRVLTGVQNASRRIAASKNWISEPAEDIFGYALIIRSI